MKILIFLKKIRFFLLLVPALYALDYIAELHYRNSFISEGRFYHNDYEVTKRDHPEEVWDKVFFGNSLVISSYREDVSTSEFVNLGVDYGVITDLFAMIDQNLIHIGSELVIGMNDLTLYDDFLTNPDYPWHRKKMEPFCYFYRDRMQVIVKDVFRLLLAGEPMELNAFASQSKIVYHGSMTPSELKERVETAPFINMDQPIEDFSGNLQAFRKIIEYCRDNGIRLRVIWMPVNPATGMAQQAQRVFDAVESICTEENIRFLDLSDALPVPCFYDTGHLNYEYGAYCFTELFDKFAEETE